MSEKRDPFDGDYIGNIFGPKITLYGGLLILFFVAIILYRHWKLDVPFGLEDPAKMESPMENDSTKLQE
ncbi:MAG: hypothetical protein DA408_03095 [Bacteroidetes bacterium]|nr:MAG: hypothetical protein C7N36_01120 [Bacteroidota bacterium]PTM14273.1 MAG: hypothetical protein DA408_03095 [Bacteroidota bacterium]